jgi:hypothetical protein
LQQNDLPAIISKQQSEMDNDNDVDDADDNDAEIQSMNQISVKPSSNAVNFSFIKI